jgi:DNA mismatch repair ATPase MutS
VQVALLVFMAHMGCFVPADACTVGLADRIITRIVSQERLAQQQSTFMVDLTQASALRWAGALSWAPVAIPRAAALLGCKENG